MKCSQCEDLFAAHIDGLLDDALAVQLETHLANCSACRFALDETRRLFDHLMKDGQDAFVLSLSSPVMDRIIQKQDLQLRRNIQMKRIAKFTVGIALVVGLCIGFSLLISALAGGRAYADNLAAARKQIEQAKTATWKTKFYQSSSSKDSEAQRRVNDQIARQTRLFSYKAPGLYRDVTVDDSGEITWITIEDNIRRKRLDLNFKAKTATLHHLAEPNHGSGGPFSHALHTLERENLEYLGTKDIEGQKANGFRYSFVIPHTNENSSYDVWIHAETKQLISFQVPGVDVLDPDKVYKERVKLSSGGLMHDIVFGAKLDDSLFSFEPPDGFTFKSVGAPEFTEKDVIEYLGILVEYFDKTFPDSALKWNHGTEYDRFSKIERMPRDERTPAQNRLVEYRQKHFDVPGLGPLHVFVHHQIVEGSWKYLGKGVEFGDKSRIVCWYKLRGSKTYRVIYGDLSVKDVATEDLLLPLER